LGGVTVTLEDGSGNVIATTTTNPDGSYEFDGLASGNYVVVVTPPAGTQTEDPDASADSQTAITLSTGGSSVGNDFGYNDSANLNDVSGTVFLDDDANGVEDAGEIGIETVTLDLLDSAGNVIASTTTDTLGNYTFEDLPNGDYQVVVSDQNNRLTGYDLTSALDAIDVTVAGANVEDVDFGYVNDQATGSISGEVFVDENADGSADPTETNFAGVDVYLCNSPVANVPCDPGDSEFVAQTITDANGDYVFTDLPAGEYLVDVDTSDVPSNLSQSVDPAVVSLSEGENADDVDHGFVPDANTGLLEGTTWVDADGDGIYDSGEVPLPGVDVLIYDTSTLTPTLLATVTTDANGNWSYVVDPIASSADDILVTYTESTVDSELDGSQPTNLAAGDDQYAPVEVYSDPDNFIGGLDFGFEPNVSGSLGSISGTIYTDSNENNDYAAADDNELQGVTVNLLDSSGNVIATTITDANGAYSFTQTQTTKLMTLLPQPSPFLVVTMLVMWTKAIWRISVWVRLEISSLLIWTTMVLLMTVSQECLVSLSNVGLIQI